LVARDFSRRKKLVISATVGSAFQSVAFIAVRVSQYVYFSLRSELVDPGAMSEAVGLLPDETALMGSRRAAPVPIPRCHLWKLNSGINDKACLDDHFEALLAKLQGSAHRVRVLVESGEVSAAIEVVRSFEPGAEDSSVVAAGRNVGSMERLGGQHPLVGFEVSAALVAYAAEAGIGFDFDEYGSEE
jgi:hypothetical protein